ncbi:hypothetical protein DFP83_10182 [Idiomarina fontislapidosi]|uniref:hypothetical protein n=1 Tax=Idiomarina fontislapidosi TaxID=263723 RepID=UPI000D8A40E7|nr:hypothetical protein [Idiomarina fontislapidosi]PYE35208.1 hypothetical protein DFP83_10182 [Idiomarina fontislapidosi]|tara:strand:- start:13685 stop:13852 length:168 start_codon:yes stop_codon:yes gene_type:complete
MTIDWASINRQLDETLKRRAQTRWHRRAQPRSVQQILSKDELDALRTEFERARSR